jgi:hypothetical protein
VIDAARTVSMRESTREIVELTHSSGCKKERIAEGSEPNRSAGAAGALRLVHGKCSRGRATWTSLVASARSRSGLYDVERSLARPFAPSFSGRENGTAGSSLGSMTANTHFFAALREPRWMSKAD